MGSRLIMPMDYTPNVFLMRAQLGFFLEGLQSRATCTPGLGVTEEALGSQDATPAQLHVDQITVLRSMGRRGWVAFDAAKWWPGLLDRLAEGPNREAAVPHYRAAGWKAQSTGGGA